MYIATQVLLTFLSTFTAPDLCDVVDETTGTPTICIPHADGAPVYNADLCCRDGKCVPKIGDACITGQKRFYCELGEVDAVGKFSCYFEVPNYCDVFPCELEINSPEQEETICCVNGICTPYIGSAGTCDEANVYQCESVKENPDGTVECLDWEGE
jgi:hypothetical protein